MSGRINVQTAGQLRRLVIDRPERSNALTPELATALRTALVDAGADPDVRAVILAGAGERAFCAGFDLGRVRASHRDSGLDELMASIEELPVPIVAALSGHAVGAGLELACRCDLRVVSRGVRVGLPAVRLGVAYRADGIAAMLATTPALRRVLLTGQAVPADDVPGFADVLVDGTEFDDAVTGLGTELCHGAPRAMSYLVKVMRANRAGGSPDGYPDFDDERERLMAGPDLAEGLAARRERRDAVFAPREVH